MRKDGIAMKRLTCLILCLMLLCGCQSADPVTDETEKPTAHLGATEIQIPDVTIPKIEQETVTLDGTGCVRIPYQGNVSSVRYVTSVEELPDNEALAAYDEAFFEAKALVVVKESVSSGSVQVGIASIENGVVTLSHEMPGDAGTADMATWLLWAEVEKDLDCSWSVANPALESDTVTH